MGYSPTTPPDLGESEVQSFSEWLQLELDAVARGMDEMQLPERNTAPAKPRAGMIVLADGTNWNPGSGAGFYGYYGGSWVKLG